MSALGFSVNELIPRARGGGQLKIGLAKLDETDWLQHAPDLTARNAAFDAHPDGVQLSPQVEEPGRELAAMLGVDGGIEQAARNAWEDMCLLTRSDGEDAYSLVGAAVAFPTDWHPADKMGLPMTALHAPIQGYEEQLSAPVDRFMAKLKPGAIYGRCNWFIAPTGDNRWIAEGPPETRFAHVTPDNAGETLFARSERQTLRRLPQTGAILFTIGVYTCPFADLTDENLGRLAAAVSEIGTGEGDRRGAPHYASALTAYARQRKAV